MKERQIRETRNFMRLLLTTELFDSWPLIEAQITCANTWTVDGHINRAYFSQDTSDNETGEDTENASFSRWADVRPVALSLIRGKRTPLSFQFILHEKDDPERICRIRFADGHVYAASAVSMKTFSLDKEPERAWDEALSRFLDENGIDFEEI